MNNQSFSKLTNEQQEKIINNVVGAVQLLYQSVKQRKAKEFVENINMKMKDEGEKNGKYKRV